MPTHLSLALQIALIGMSLVFGAIVLFWGLMSLLVRATADRTERLTRDERDLRRRAAVAAVAAALAELQARGADEKPHVPPLPPTALLSAWQVAMRANQLNQRGPVR